jgi:two-component system, OmpR family, response regulator MtrA
MVHIDSVARALAYGQDPPSRPVIWILDDPLHATAIAKLLEGQGHEAQPFHFTTALDTLRARIACPSMILLELVQSGVGGLVLCSKLRSLTDVPIVVYSYTRRSADPAACQRLGANAFVHKSSPHSDLLLWIRRLLGPSSRSASREDRQNHSTVCVGALAIETSGPRAVLNGTPVDLTPTEHRLLLVLAKTPGMVFSKRDLALSVWGSVRLQAARRLSTHVQRVRAKLHSASTADAPQLLSIRGVGYCLSPSKSVATGANEPAPLPQAA